MFICILCVGHLLMVFVCMDGVFVFYPGKSCVHPFCLNHPCHVHSLLYPGYSGAACMRSLQTDGTDRRGSRAARSWAETIGVKLPRPGKMLKRAS